MTNTPPKIDKYDGTHIKWFLTKLAHLVKKMPKSYLPKVLSRAIFKRELLICCRTQTHNHGILKSILTLIAGAGSISRVLVVLQKTNNISFEMVFFVRCRFCEMPFL